MGRCKAGLLALPHRMSHGPWGLPGQLRALAGFYGPFTCPVSDAGQGFVVWNTFLIKPGNEQGTQVVHAAPDHGAGTGLHHHQFLPSLTLANPSCPVTLCPPWITQCPPAFRVAFNTQGWPCTASPPHTWQLPALLAPAASSPPASTWSSTWPPTPASPGVALSGTSQAVTH